jgi:hypothetical protein
MTPLGDRCGLGARAVFHVIHRHAVDIVRPGKRRTDPHLAHGHAFASSGRLLERRPVVWKAFDQPVDEVVRPGVRNIAHNLRYVDHLVALEDAEREIIEVQQFHLVLLCCIAECGTAILL